MKKLLLLICCFIFTVSIMGCAKLVSTETKNVEVKIVDTYHRGAYTQPVRIGKTTSIRTYPAKWHVYVEYDNVEYSISGKDTYDCFKDKIGEPVTGILEIRTYDNGEVKLDIIELIE